MAAGINSKYPGLSLGEAVAYVRKVHDQVRQRSISRDALLECMGFSKRSGSSDKAFSSLVYYGLIEKVAGGEVRVTSLALRIMHPETEDERRAALSEAAYTSVFFRQLRDRYPGEPPSQANLSSYLSRENLTEIAVSLASRAYLETCALLQKEGAYELPPLPQSDFEEVATKEEKIASRTAISPSGPSVRPGTTKTLKSDAELPLNEIRVKLRDGRVHVEALLDYKGLSRLEKRLKPLMMLLEPEADEAVAG